jgi:hypothetical protein
MSEVSNISKGSLPASNLPPNPHPRQASSSSRNFSNTIGHHSNSNHPSAQRTTLHPPPSPPPPPHAAQSLPPKPASAQSNQTLLKERIQSNSSKQLQQLSTTTTTTTTKPTLSSHPANDLQSQRRNTVQYETNNRTLLLKKPGSNLQNPNHNSITHLNTTTTTTTTNNQTNGSSIPTMSQSQARTNVSKSLLLINTNNMLITCSPVASPTVAATAAAGEKSATEKSTLVSSSARNKMEIKLNKEIERLEALCESRTKELSLLKLKLRETVISFDAIAIAYKYLSVDLNGFEVTSLRKRLNGNKRASEMQLKRLTLEIDEKEKLLQTSKENLDRLALEASETKIQHDKHVAFLEEELKIQLNLKQMEHDLIVKDLKQDKDVNIRRLQKLLDAQKSEFEKAIDDLNESLESKVSENADLNQKIKEFEETLAKDKDERIQRLLDTQHNLEKEIESLKTALDIKNLDIFDLRTKNNELITKVDNYTDMNMKLRRYKQEVEQLTATLNKKQEAERQTSEYNRQLSMKIEVKQKENQRLSMANEQLQFRLQSHPNLSSNQDTSLNSSSFVSFSEETPKDTKNTIAKQQLQLEKQQPRHTRAYTLHPSSAMTTSSEDSADSISVNGQSPQPPPVKLRSKSFKSQYHTTTTTTTTITNDSSSSNPSNSMNKSLYSTLNYQKNQFRPISDTFNFNLDDQNVNMTKSFNVMYDKHNNSSSSNDNQINYFERNEEDFKTDLDANDEELEEEEDDDEESASGSTSSLKSSSISNTNYTSHHRNIKIIKEDQMTKSVPCMALKGEDSNSQVPTEEFSDDDEESYSKSSELEYGS